MIQHRVDSIKEKHIAELKAEMLAHDYRAIKVIWEKYGNLIEQEYPGETEWRDGMIAKINELEGEG
jgi:hypothetical protein